MFRLTPLEKQVVHQVAEAVVREHLPVVELKVFGSRARGHSNEHSDLDIAVVLDGEPDRDAGLRVADIANRVSQALGEDEAHYPLRIQLVPLFHGDEQGYLARTIAHEAVTVWTKT